MLATSGERSIGISTAIPQWCGSLKQLPTSLNFGLSMSIVLRELTRQEVSDSGLQAISDLLRLQSRLSPIPFDQQLN